MKFRFKRKKDKISSLIFTLKITSTIFLSSLTSSFTSSTISRNLSTLFATFVATSKQIFCTSMTSCEDDWYWYKKQSESVKKLNEWLEVLITAKFLSKLSIAFTSFETSTTIFQESVITLKRSRFSLFTLKFISKRVKIASTRSFTFSISLATSSSKHRKSISKFYLTIDDLRRMFAEKFKSFDLPQHQNRRFSSQSLDTRSSISYQFRIIFYFSSAINQKASINQSLKSSKSKNFQQYMFAKSLSFYRLTVLFEKSTFSSYKKSDIFYISLQSKFSTRFSTKFLSKFSFAWSSLTFSSFFRSSLSNLHVCCICFDHFSFNNDLFNYSRRIQRYLSKRRLLKEISWSFRNENEKRKKDNVTNMLQNSKFTELWWSRD